MAQYVSATTGPTPGIVIKRRHTSSSPTMASKRRCRMTICLRIGSISKTISSVAIFRLIQSGATYDGGTPLTLDSPVFGPHGLLPDLDVPPQLAPLKDARLRHFLEHTAGLPGQNSKEEVGDPLNCASGDLVRRIASSWGRSR